MCFVFRILRFFVARSGYLGVLYWCLFLVHGAIAPNHFNDLHESIEIGLFSHPFLATGILPESQKKLLIS